MFSVISRIFNPPAIDPADIREAGPTVVDEYKMTLYERKAWRLEMMRQSIKHTFTKLEILGGMYRFRVMSLDERGHYYAVMVETTKHFATSKHVNTPYLSVIEDSLKSYAFDNYGIMVEGVYWKVTETINMFQRATDSVELPDTPPPRRRPSAVELERSFSDTQPVIYAETVISPRQPRFEPITADEEAAFRSAIATQPQYEPITADEAAAFRAAIASRRQPPAIYVGNKEYATDHAPLGFN